MNENTVISGLWKKKTSKCNDLRTNEYRKTQNVCTILSILASSKNDLNEFSKKVETSYMLNKQKYR